MICKMLTISDFLIVIDIFMTLIMCYALLCQPHMEVLMQKIPIP